MKNSEIGIENDSSSVTSIELFVGAGGLELSLEKAEIETKTFVEVDKYCCEILRRNRHIRAYENH